MTRYTAHYGNWREPDGVILISYSNNPRDTSTSDFRTALSRAQQVANETGRTVTIIGERGTANGLRITTYHVPPKCK